MQRLIRVLLVLSLLVACREQRPAYPHRPVPSGLLADETAIRAGAAMFAGRCASCHGHPHEGRSPRAVFFEPPAPTFGEPRYRDIDPAYLFWRIERGKTVEPYLSRGSVMPGWRPYLSDEQIWQLVAYLRRRADGKTP